MQRSIKKDLGDSNSTERDIRRIFEQEHGQAINAEKLSFILESLETLKVRFISFIHLCVSIPIITHTQLLSL